MRHIFGSLSLVCFSTSIQSTAGGWDPTVLPVPPSEQSVLRECTCPSLPCSECYRMVGLNSASVLQSEWWSSWGSTASSPSIAELRRFWHNNVFSSSVRVMQDTENKWYFIPSSEYHWRLKSRYIQTPHHSTVAGWDTNMSSITPWDQLYCLRPNDVFIPSSVC